MTAAAKRFTYIDALRGIAALGVVLVHLRDSHHLPAFFAAMPVFVDWMIGYGHVGVEIFFVLSGFVIAHSMARDDVDLRYVGRYMLRRSARLAPPYWASIAMSMIGLAWAVYHWGDTKVSLPSVGDIALHLVYAQGFFGVRAINTVFWTLSMEVQFYLVFGLMMIVSTRLHKDATTKGKSVFSRTQAFWVVMTPALIFASLWPVGQKPWTWVHVVFTEKWHLFLLGAMAWKALQADAGGWSLPAAWAYALFLAIAALYHHNLPLAVGVVTATSILVCGRTANMASWLSSRPWQFLGAISYSLYLVHNPITGLVFGLGYGITPHSRGWQTLWFFVDVGMCIGVAYIFHRVLELPSLRLSQKIARVAPPHRG
jgi:peptidoglycan/LPS O-acetylase OafA/YrhL